SEPETPPSPADPTPGPARPPHARPRTGHTRPGNTAAAATSTTYSNTSATHRHGRAVYGNLWTNHSEPEPSLCRGQQPEPGEVVAQRLGIGELQRGELNSFRTGDVDRRVVDKDGPLGIDAVPVDDHAEDPRVRLDHPFAAGDHHRLQRVNHRCRSGRVVERLGRPVRQA